MFKNWSNTKKIVWALVIVALLVAAYNWKAIAKQFGYNGDESVNGGTQNGTTRFKNGSGKKETCPDGQQTGNPCGTGVTDPSTGKEIMGIISLNSRGGCTCKASS